MKKEYFISKKITKNKKNKPYEERLVFGKNFTDHYFVMDYIEGEGWINPRIIPYEPFLIEPCAMVFHYGGQRRHHSDYCCVRRC